uniref:THIF-type NAD/FAD binding fold domain-containing protein n=1 Tax=Oncorhynchus mykiss TaxID=8022 RepID=A0A8C7PG14_ONCMY
MPATTRLISRLTVITAICQQLTSEGATVVVADIREESANQPWCRYFQPPSVCVNAAGVTQDDFSLKMEDEDFDKSSKGMTLCSYSPKRSIIAVGSIVGKSDILTIGPSVIRHYRCNCLPGFITTPMTDKLTSMVPLGRMGEPAGRNTVYTTLYAIDHTTNAELCTFL